MSETEDGIDTTQTDPPLLVIEHKNKKNKKNKKKKKKKYSRGMKDLQCLVEGAVQASARTTRAVSDGVTHVDKCSRRSARKRRDGAVRDGLEAWARGIGKTIEKSAGVPNDIAKPLNKAVRRQLRALTRLGIPLIRLR